MSHVIHMLLDFISKNNTNIPSNIKTLLICRERYTKFTEQDFVAVVTTFKSSSEPKDISYVTHIILDYFEDKGFREFYDNRTPNIVFTLQEFETAAFVLRRLLINNCQIKAMD